MLTYRILCLLRKHYVKPMLTMMYGAIILGDLAELHLM